MKIKFNNFQALFLGIYVFFNTYALFYLLNYQETFGDYFEPVSSDWLVFVAYALIILPFVFFGWYLYPYFQYKLKTCEIVNKDIVSKLSWFVLFLQVSFIVFNLITGVNTAGSGFKTDSPVKYIFIIFSPDTFFLILYGFGRKNKLFKYNLLTYLFSSVQRGWMGGIFFIAVMELYIYYIKYGFSKKIVFVTSSIVGILVLLLPYIVMMKWAARVYFGGVSSEDFNQELQLVLNLGHETYLGSLAKSFSYLFGRFQVLSNVYLFLEHLDTLQLARENGQFVSSFVIGLPQMLVYKIFGLDYTVLTSYFVSVIDTKVVLSELTSNTHVGYIGWILAEPYYFWLFFAYTILLVYLVAYFSSKIGGKYIHFVSWYFLIAYLMHGWLQAYFGYMLELMIFYIVKIIMKKIKFKKLENNK